VSAADIIKLVLCTLAGMASAAIILNLFDRRRRRW